MAKKTVNQNSHKATAISANKNTVPKEPKDLLGIINTFLDQRLGWLIWVILAITCLSALLLFDSKVSLSGDDSFYIIKASDFIHSFKYPTFYGPLYPMVLSIVIAIFGINLVPLKLLSLLSILGFVYLFFIAFRSRIPSVLLVIILSAISVNSYVLYYASQTYSEAFYTFMQMVLVFVFFRGFIDNEHPLTLKQDFKRHMLLALSLLALVLTRNVGYSAAFALTGYFTLRGQWKNLFYLIVAFAFLFVVFQGIKYLLWSDSGLQFSTQGANLSNKDYYNPQAGKEDFAGYVTRLVVNSQMYLSKHFLAAIGLRNADPAMKTSIIVTILIYLMAIGSLIITYTKNKYIFFTGLLSGSFILVSFIILQANWDQSRLIIPTIPLLLLTLISLIYYVSSMKKYKFLQFMIPLLGFIIFFQSFALTARTIKENQKISGRFGGLTPDWKNYLKASEWAAANLPKDAIVACRKPSISFVYGKGHNFYGIMQLPSYSTEVFINNWLKEDSSYALFNYADFGGKQLKPELISMLKGNMVAMIFIGDTVLFADKINDNIKSSYYNELKTAGLNYFSSANTLKSLLNEGKVVKLYYPDSLLTQLQNQGVTHILTANLRRNASRKDGFTINTVERYMAFIQEKYPFIFTKVSQIGDDANEPATIVKINYEKYGRSVKKLSEN